MSAIGDFLTEYKADYQLYRNLAAETADLCETYLKLRGIKAIVSSRAKSPESLNAKIVRLDRSLRFRKADDIQKRLTDLVGVRIAVYFPGDRQKVEDLINRKFKVLKKKAFPAGRHSPDFNKRFSGYWATHYIVDPGCLDVDHKLYKRGVEIQVASVLMHAWAEIEHDLVYKPLNGSVSEEEFAILDELNGMVLSGEIALERLKKAMDTRIKADSRFNDDYELASFIYDNIDSSGSENENIGDTSQLNFFLEEFSQMEVDDLQRYLKATRFNKDKSIASQLLDSVLYDFFIKKDNSVVPLFDFFQKNGSDYLTGKEVRRFLTVWLYLEKIIYAFMSENEDVIDGFFPIQSRLAYLENTIAFKSSRSREIAECSLIKDSLLCGETLYSSDILKKKIEDLYSISKKILREFSNETTKTTLYYEMKKHL